MASWDFTADSVMVKAERLFCREEALRRFLCRWALWVGGLRGIKKQFSKFFFFYGYDSGISQHFGDSSPIVSFEI